MAVIEPAGRAARMRRTVRLRRRLGAVMGRLSSPAFVKRMLYSVYGARVQSRMAAAPMPRHIGLVLDGNRRYAEINGLDDAADGYRGGTKKADELLAWCDELDVPVVTLWSLSIDNLSRSPIEIESLTHILEETLPHLRDVQRKAKRPRRIHASGRLELLPPSIREAFAEVERDTAGYEGYHLNIALGYGGREEIVDAVKTLLAEEERAGRSPQQVAGHQPAHLPGRRAGPGPHHPHQRRGAPQRLPALWQRLQRVLPLRRPLARLPQDRLPTRHPAATRTGSGATGIEG